MNICLKIELILFHVFIYVPRMICSICFAICLSFVALWICTRAWILIRCNGC